MSLERLGENRWVAATLLPLAAFVAVDLGCDTEQTPGPLACVDCEAAGGQAAGGQAAGGQANQGGSDVGAGGLGFEGPAPDFALVDVNATSPTHDDPVSPRDYLEQVSAWYFAHAS